MNLKQQSVKHGLAGWCGLANLLAGGLGTLCKLHMITLRAEQTAVEATECVCVGGGLKIVLLVESLP